jgi:hypothetical protein
MKSLKRFLPILLGVATLAFSACDKEEVEATFHKPVLNTDFTVVVNGNNVVLNCTMQKATSYLWELSTGDQSTQKLDTVYLPMAGTYFVKLSVSNGGDFLTSDSVEVTIAQTDVAIFESGVWKALTGGAGVTKTWVLDTKKMYFHNPVDFYGDEEAGGSATNIWGPWGGFGINDPEPGEITFDATSGIAKLIMDGVTTQGKFTMSVYDRPADFLTLTANNGGVSLWENMLTNKYSYLVELSSQMADLHMPAGVRFPLQIGRVTNDGNVNHPSQFLTEDLENVLIMHASDSALVIRVKRSFEGDNVNKCWMLYNFIVKEYDYGQVVTYTEPVNTTFAKADLVGTWKYDQVPVDWISWSGSDNSGNVLLNAWADSSAMFTAGWAVTSATFSTIANNTYVFNADGSCNLNGTANTYTYSGGVLTFGTALAGTELQIPCNGWSMSLTGTEVKVMKPTNSTGGLWLGQRNDAKDESKCVHLVKK